MPQIELAKRVDLADHSFVYGGVAMAEIPTPRPLTALEQLRRELKFAGYSGQEVLKHMGAQLEAESDLEGQVL